VMRGRKVEVRGGGREMNDVANDRDKKCRTLRCRTLGSQRCCARPGIFSLGGQYKDSHVPGKS